MYVLGFCAQHRRRIELEDKAKVVASVWGTESLPRWLFCLSLFGTNGRVQPFIPNRPAEFNHLFQIDRLDRVEVLAGQNATWFNCKDGPGVNKAEL